MKIHEPPMTFAPGVEEKWNQGLENNKDPYGRACYRYASEWATRMEKGMAEAGVDTANPVLVTKWLVDNANRAASEADDEGITGYMYGCAVSILAGAWVHGEQLRRWHNKETQIGTEGDRANETDGVLNPAMLSLG